MKIVRIYRQEASRKRGMKSEWPEWQVRQGRRVLSRHDTEDEALLWIKQTVLREMEAVDALDLPDAAHWQRVAARLGMEPGDVEAIIADDPAFFGARPAP